MNDEINKFYKHKSRNFSSNRRLDQMTDDYMEEVNDEDEDNSRSSSNKSNDSDDALENEILKEYEERE